MNRFKFSAFLALSFLIVPAQGAAFLKQALPHVASLSVLYAPAVFGINYNLAEKSSWEKRMDNNPALVDAASEIKKVVDQELNRYNRSIPNLKVIFSDDFDYAMGMGNTLVVDNHFYTDLFKSGLISSNQDVSAVKEDQCSRSFAITDPVERKKLADKVRHVIHHEASHIQHNDFYKKLASYTMEPLALYGTTLLALNRIKHPVKRGLGKAAALVPMFYANTAWQHWMMRHQERLADNAVPNDVDLLRGGIESMKDDFDIKSVLMKLESSGRLSDAQKEMIKEISEASMREIQDEQGLFSKIGQKIFATHPTDEERIETFKKRIAEIESHQKNG